MYKRTQTKKIKVGNAQIGGQNKVVIQSMCNTRTKDTTKTINQILELESAGCEIIRVSCLDLEDAKSIKEIKNNIHIPLVADIHFDYKLALEAIKNGVDKVRINPGNIGNKEKIKMIVDSCKENNIPIRIGVNSGSIESQILKENNGEISKSIVDSAIKNIRILEDFNFDNIILSLKSSNIDDCINAYKQISNLYNYPLHLGVTESGTLLNGTIKSSICLGYLLKEGLGDTIRVSLTANPLEEIKVAKEILKNLNLYNLPTLISCPTCGRTRINVIELSENIEEFLKTIKIPITVAIMGCVVNGVGEARHADIGIAGGVNEGALFKEGKIIKKIPEKYLLEELKKEILYMQENRLKLQRK